MDSEMIKMILNIVLAVFVVLGFLFGLKGLKKTSLSLGFFVASLLVTTLITPLVSKALLGIKLPLDGESISLSEYIVKLINSSGIVKDLSASIGSLEGLINNIPLIVINLVTFVLLVYIVGFIFKIGYWITAHILFGKKKNKISKTAPANVSATGNVTYQAKDYRTEKKHRLLGGLVGAVHGLILLVATLLPVAGTVGIVSDITFSKEEVEVPVAQVVLDVSGETSKQTEMQYTATAKLIQDSLGEDVVEILEAVDGSITFNVCHIVDFADVWYNSIAKCKVNNQKIVLRKELTNVANIYNNVMYITDSLGDLDEFSPSKLKNIDFDKVDGVIDSVFDSALLKTVTPEVVSTILDWVTADDISGFSAETQDFISGLQEQLDDNAKDLLVALKNLFADEEKIVNTVKGEFKNIVDIAEIVCKSDLLDKVIVPEGEEIDIDAVLDVVKADDCKLPCDILDKVFSSDIVNLVSLTGTNYLLDFVEDTFVSLIPEESRDSFSIPSIKVSETTDRFDCSVFKNMIKLSFNLYDKYNEIGFDNIGNDFSLLVTEDFDKVLGDFGKVFDSIKDASVFSAKAQGEKSIYESIAYGLSLAEFDLGDSKVKLSEYVDFNATIKEGYKFETEFKNLKDVIVPVLTKKIDDEPVVMVVMSGEIEIIDVLKEFTKEEINGILSTISSSEFLKPASEKLVEIMNDMVKQTLEGVELPENIDLSECSEELVEIIVDAIDLLPDFEAIANKETDIKEVLADEEKKESVVSLLETIEESEVFEEMLDSVVNYVEELGFTDLSTLIEDPDYQKDNGSVDWAKLIDKFVQPE